jgi:hypothetical protein
VLWRGHALQISVPTAVITNEHMTTTRIPSRRHQYRFESGLITACTEMMRWFSVLHAFFWGVSQNTRFHFCKLIPLLICIPCFQGSHFFFKLACLLNHRRLCRLCSEDLFLKFYNGFIPSGSVVNVLQSFRNVESRLKALTSIIASHIMMRSPRARLPPRTAFGSHH